MICFDDPKYWRDKAANERANANEDRARRGGTVESIRIHERNAAEYEARAIALESVSNATQQNGSGGNPPLST